MLLANDVRPRLLGGLYFLSVISENKSLTKQHHIIRPKQLYIYIYIFIYFLCASTQFRVVASSDRTSQSHSDTPHSVGLLWTSDRPEAETSTCTTHNTRKRQTTVPPAGFESTIPASERPQTHALDRPASGIGYTTTLSQKIATYFGSNNPSSG